MVLIVIGIMVTLEKIFQLNQDIQEKLCQDLPIPNTMTKWTKFHLRKKEEILYSNNSKQKSKEYLMQIFLELEFKLVRMRKVSLNLENINGKLGNR